MVGHQRNASSTLWLESRRTAHLVNAAGDEVFDHLVDRPFMVLGAMLLSAVLYALLGGFGLTLAVLAGWLATQVLVGCGSSCCRTFGGCGAFLVILGLLLGGNQLGGSTGSSRPLRAGTLYFDLEGGGAGGGIAGAGGGIAGGADFNITLAESDGVRPRSEHYPVLLLPSGSYARLAISCYDAAGRLLLPATAFALGPDDAFPWLPAAAAGAPAAARLPLGAAPAAAATAAASSAAVAAVAATSRFGGDDATGSFAASSRRTRRRLRGRMMRGVGGARSFSRGVGTFGSPLRSSRSSPSSTLRRPTGAHTPHGGHPPIAHGVPVAHGYRPDGHRPGVAHHTQPGYAGHTTGYHTHPAAMATPGSFHRGVHFTAYPTPILHDPFFTGLMAAHVLRHSSPAHHHWHHYHHQGAPGGPLHAGAAGDRQQALAAPGDGGADGEQPHAFYFGQRAMPSGTRLKVVPTAYLAAGPWAAGAAQAAATHTGCKAPMPRGEMGEAPPPREACGLTRERVLGSGYDRYVLVGAAVRTPPRTAEGGRWPLLLRVHPLKLERKGDDPAPGTPGTPGTAPGTPGTPETAPGTGGGQPSAQDVAEPAPLIGLQQARPEAEPRRVALARGMQRGGQLMLMLLLVVALLGLSTDPEGGTTRMRLGGRSTRAVAAEGSAAAQVSADGELVGVGTRVQTQWLREEGGDGRWYAGVVVALYPGGARATVEYDDGELWTGSLGRVYTLRGDEDEDEEAAQGVPMAQGSAVRGVPMAVGRRV